MTIEERKAKGYAALVRALRTKSGTGPVNPADLAQAACAAGWHDREKALYWARIVLDTRVNDQR